MPGQRESRPRRVVVAPDKLRGSCTAGVAAEALARGLAEVVPDVEVLRRPVADGGEGTLDAALAAGFTRHPVTVPGPTGGPVRTAVALRDGTAVVELADCCGQLRLTAGPAPLAATTAGLGEAVRHALDLGARTVVVGLGGSASTDGGVGLLTALGARALDASGRPLAPGGGALVDLARLDLTGLDQRLATATLVAATDVSSPLLGPSGAARRFGPQKGAGPQDVERLESGLARLADVVAVDRRDVPGAGAAGGAGFGLLVLGARVVSGADFVLDLLGLSEAVAGSLLVVTGEGSWDAQTGTGKAPAAVAALARDAGVPVAAVAGRFEVGEAELAALGVVDHVALLDLTDPPGDLAVAQRDAVRLLQRAGRRFASLLARPSR